MARSPDRLPAFAAYRRFLPLTLVVTFQDGKSIKVPYFDYDTASNYLESLPDLEDFRVIPYTGD